MSRHRMGGEGMSRAAKVGISLTAVAAVAALVVGGALLSTHHGAKHPAVAQSPVPTFTGTPSASPSPKPSQTPTPADCSNAPHLCGFPDATNSGVPAQMRSKLLSVPGQVSSGPGWHYDPRGWVEVDGNGAVLKGLSIPYNVDVTASDVTIEDDVIVNTGDGFGVSIRHSHGVTVKDCDISSPYTDSRRLMVGVKDVYGDATGTKVIGNNIWHTATGVQIGTGLIAGNYIHSIGFKPGDHVNGITVNGSTSPLTIRHNTVFVNLNQTDAISLFEDFGVEANKLIKDNLVAGGDYSIYGGAKSGGPQSYNIRIIGNRFSRKYYSNGGQFGPAAYFDSGPGNVWSGNIWDGTKAVVYSP
jgi:Right handed beta helix region